MDTNRRYTIVRLPPQEKDVYFVVPGVHPEPDVSRYSVEEGSCPTNWLSDIEAIIIDGDTDPHGLFEYVRDIQAPAFLDKAHNPVEEWAKVIPEAFPEKS